MANFLDAVTFANWAKNPAWATDPLAASLLTVVSDWIRDRKPDIVDDDPAAQVVTFEVTRDAMLYGEFGPVTSFTKIVGHRQQTAAIDRAAVEKFITDRHKRILGLPIKAAPRGHFPKCDY